MSRQSVINEETCRRDHDPASDCGDVGVTTQCTFCGQLRVPGCAYERPLDGAPQCNCQNRGLTADAIHPAVSRADTTISSSNVSQVSASQEIASPAQSSLATASSPDKQQKDSLNLRTRRNLLAGVAALALTPVLSSAAAASSKIRKQIVYPERSLSLNNVHTGENERVVYWADGTYLTEGLNRINWILRDFRTSETKSIDPRLLNILYLLTRTLDVHKPVLVLSGYRSKKTNDMLRRTTEGVARRSFHMAGRAIDIRMPAVPTQHVQRAALHLGGGGVGYYPSSNFVHLDSGPVRTW